MTAGGGGVSGDADSVEVAVLVISALLMSRERVAEMMRLVASMLLWLLLLLSAVEGVGGVAGDAAAPVVVVVVVETQGQRGVSEIRGAGLSMVDVEGTYVAFSHL